MVEVSVFGFSILNARQPEHRGNVVEVLVNNRLGRWIRTKFGRAAITLPFFFGVCFVLYWMLPEEKLPSPYARVHEWVHVEQWQRPGPFYVQYLGALMKDGSYSGNDLEEEARAVVDRCRVDGLPGWAA